MKAGSKIKKAPKMSKPEDESGREAHRRGRPRVESHDESAAERRRTQIRLAQRAYRERKETTISGLEAQVSNLKHVIREISNIFNELSGKAMVSGILNVQPVFNNDFRLAMERLAELSQSAGGEDDNLSGTFSTVSPVSRQSSISQSKSTTPPTHAIHTAHYAEPIMLDSRHGIDDASIGMLGYEFDYSSPAASMIVHNPNMVPSQGWADPWTLNGAVGRSNRLNDRVLPTSPGWKI